MLPRCSKGYVLAIRNGQVQVCFGTPAGRVQSTLDPSLLEASPGTMSHAMALMLRPMDWYKTGLMLSDVRFPRTGTVAGDRFAVNMRQCMSDMQGTSIFPNIDAFSSKECFQRLYGWPEERLEDVGLVLVMAAHPWWRDTPYRTATDFHEGMVNALMRAWRCRVVLLIRTDDAAPVYARMHAWRRVHMLPSRDVEMHYVPLQMHRNTAMVPVVCRSGWCAIVIEPTASSQTLQKLHVPTEILNTMLRGKCTLELASFTAESAVASLAWIRAQRDKHGV